MDNQSYQSPVGMQESHITGKFWTDYLELIRTSVIPYQWDALNDRIPDAKPSHCMRNFRIASGRELGTHGGYPFQDSDVAKWIEAAAYTLMRHPDPKLMGTVDSAIDEIVAIQQPDGYLNSYYTIKGLSKRFTNVKDHHELYCLGHFIEAAVAYFEATGKDKLLKAIIEYVDLADRTFGSESYKLPGYPGHEEIELALVKLYSITDNPRHLALAKYFIDQRGQSPNYFDEETRKHKNPDHWSDGIFKNNYYQAQIPVREQPVAAGHAVRAVYLYTGMAEVAKKTNDPTLISACRRLWKDLTQKQMYITGAIGQSDYGEALTYGYDLPNDTLYGETCASIGLIFFAQSMLKIAPRGEYADVVERALYNGVLSGMSQDGTHYFYTNPLEMIPEASKKNPLCLHIQGTRQKWFSCACCPTNIARLLASISGYLYTKQKDILYIHQYIEGNVETDLCSGKAALYVKTDYPWDGMIHVSVMEAPDAESTIALRIPGWCQMFKLQLNGNDQFCSAVNGYVYVKNKFRQGDRIELQLFMPVTLVEANPLVRKDICKLAVTRGPIVYCLEEADNGKNLHQIRINSDQSFTSHYDANFLGGAVIIKSDGRTTESWDTQGLYRPLTGRGIRLIPLTWIPYYLWANREPGEMIVWVNG